MYRTIVLTLFVLVLFTQTIPVKAAAPQHQPEMAPKSMSKMKNRWCMYNLAWEFSKVFGATVSSGQVSIWLNQSTAPALIRILQIPGVPIIYREYDLMEIENYVLSQLKGTSIEFFRGQNLLSFNLKDNFGSEPCDGPDDYNDWPPPTGTVFVPGTIMSASISVWKLAILVLIFVLSLIGIRNTTGFRQRQNAH